MVNSSKVERKLAAIMFTDIVGYTKLMSTDQDSAIILLEEKQSKFRPLVKEHNGVLVKEMGDGTLSHYPTAVDASSCSVEFQKLIKNNDKLNVRVGIHLGDTLFKDNDIFGDGVNIASRLESMAPPGGVLVSKNVYDELLSREGFEGVSLGLQSLKGVGRLVEVYALKDKYLAIPNPDNYKENIVEAHSDDEVPSIAIIPFKNKGAEEDVFYAYGISADLITDCSSAGLIRVAGLNDIENLDYINLNYAELASKLFVRYISTGNLWKMGNMFQLSIELYDTKEKKVVWSDRWQEKWDNLPAIKGNLSDGLLKALDTKPKQEKKIETNNPEAYEFYLKAKHKYYKRENIDDTEIARGLIIKAVDLDQNLIDAKLLLGKTYREMGDLDEAMEIFSTTFKQAEQLEKRSGMGFNLQNIGIIYHQKGDYEKALDYYERSLQIAEELDSKDETARSLESIGGIYFQKGDYDKSLELVEKSLKINEKLGEKSKMAMSLQNIGLLYTEKNDFNLALNYYERSNKISEELGKKRYLGENFGKIGLVYDRKGDLDTALDYQNKSLKIRMELGNKRGIAFSLKNIGSIYDKGGEYDKALDYYMRAYALAEELDFKQEMGTTLNSIGAVYNFKGDYNKAQDYLEKALIIRTEIGIKKFELETTISLYLTYKHFGKDYNKNKIYSLIKDSEFIDSLSNVRLYELLEDRSYLETAYNQVQELVKSMDDELKEKFCSNPIPKQIIEKYNSVFLD